MVKPSGVSKRRDCSAVWGGVDFRGDGVRFPSDEGVAGVRLRRKGIFEQLHVVMFNLYRKCIEKAKKHV